MSRADANSVLNQTKRQFVASSPDSPHAAVRVVDAIRSLLGLRRRFEVGGVRYTERTSEPLHRAISRRGAGRKEFEAQFSDGTTQRIRCTPTRVYADITGPELLPCYVLAEPLLRPGMRVLDAGTGTGYGAAWLVEQVGPSGAVVALSRDRESIRYAQSRYRSGNVAFEVGWTDALTGEIDGAFDGVIACAALNAGDDAAAVVAEWWRLVAPNGWMLVVAPVRKTEARSDGLGEATSVAVPTTGSVNDGARIFAPEELSAIIAAACNKPAASDDETDRATPRFRSKANSPERLGGKSSSELTDDPVPAADAEIATASIVNYAAALVRKVARS